MTRLSGSFPSTEKLPVTKLLSTETCLPSSKWQIELHWDNFLLKYLNSKDQVCLDRVLLRIVQILNSLIFFELYGDTLKLTNLGGRKPGDLINIEVEPMLKKIVQIFEQFKH